MLPILRIFIRVTNVWQASGWLHGHWQSSMGKRTYSGPVYKKMKIDGSRVLLSFDYTEGGLKTFDGGDVKGFFISGEDERFYPAQAVIKGNKLELTSDKVMRPVAVRYGWELSSG